MKKSAELDVVRCVMNYMIVFLHAWAAFQYVDNSTVEFKAWTFLLSHMCGMAMPTFFLISGYLFFSKFMIKEYPRKMVRRAKRLLVPYIVWNTTFVVFYLLLSRFVPRLGVRVASFGLDTVSGAVSKIVSFTVPPIDGPLWFLRVLIYFSIITPIILLAIKILNKRVIAALLVALVVFEGYFGLTEKMSMVFPAYAFLCFCIGCMLAHYGRDLVSEFRSYLYLFVGAVACTLLGMDAVTGLLHLPAAVQGLLFAIQAPALITLVSHIHVERIVNNGVYRYLKDMSFFAYAGHFLFCSMFLHSIAPKLGFMTTGKMTVLVLAFVGLGVPTMAVVYGVARKICPKILKLWDGTL